MPAEVVDNTKTRSTIYNQSIFINNIIEIHSMMNNNKNINYSKIGQKLEYIRK